MIVVTAPTGQIGHQVLKNILDSGGARSYLDAPAPRRRAGTSGHFLQRHGADHVGSPREASAFRADLSSGLQSPVHKARHVRCNGAGDDRHGARQGRRHRQSRAADVGEHHANHVSRMVRIRSEACGACVIAMSTLQQAPALSAMPGEAMFCNSDRSPQLAAMEEET